MRTTDLMIGDYVTFKDCQNDDAPSIVKIEGLGYQGRGVVEEALVTIDDDEYGFDLVEIDDEFVGIPLTEKILYNNGFSNCGFYAELVTDNWQIMCDCHNVAARCTSGHSIDVQCESVHELQHVLKLCGINKDIVL